jgi:hypothetical protein
VCRRGKLSRGSHAVDHLREKSGKHPGFVGTSLVAHRFAQHLGERGDEPERKRVLLKGESKRKRLGIPLLIGEVTAARSAATRLARPAVMDCAAFASHERGKEELVAEFGAAFLCGFCGIAPKTVENAAAYIAHWIAQLRHDKILLIQAASQAQRAVDFILNVSASKENESETT